MHPFTIISSIAVLLGVVTADDTSYCYNSRYINGRFCQIRCGVDRPGGDYAQKHTGTFEACVQLCAADSTCVTAQYHKGNGWCYLKDSRKAIKYVDADDTVDCDPKGATTTVKTTTTTTTACTKVPTPSSSQLVDVFSDFRCQNYIGQVTLHEGKCTPTNGGSFILHPLENYDTSIRSDNYMTSFYPDDHCGAFSLGENSVFQHDLCLWINWNNTSVSLSGPNPCR